MAIHECKEIIIANHTHNARPSQSSSHSWYQYSDKQTATVYTGLLLHTDFHDNSNMLSIVKLPQYDDSKQLSSDRVIL